MRQILIPLLTALVPAVAQPSPASAQADTVRFDLSSASAKDDLPFHLPFALVGQAPQGVLRARVDLLRVSTPPVPPDTSGVWAQPDHSVTARPDPEGRLRFPMPELEANALYGFRVFLEKKVSPEAQAALRARALPLLRTRVGEIPAGSVNGVELRRAGEAFLAVAQGLVGRDTVLVEGTLFDPELPAEELEGRVADLLRPINSARVQADAGRTNATLAVAEASVAWEEAIAQGEIRVFLERVGQQLAGGDGPGTLEEAGLDPAILEDGVVGGTLDLIATYPGEIDGGVVASWIERLEAALDQVTAFNRGLASFTSQTGKYYPVVREAVSADSLSQGTLDSVRAALEEDGVLWRVRDHLLSAMANYRNFSLALQRLEGGLEALAGTFQVVGNQLSVGSAGTSVAYNTNSGNYVSADAGMAWAPSLGEFVPYLGVNYYFRPVNRSVPLSNRGGLGYRLSLMAGLTTRSVADTEQGRSDLFGSQAFLLGFGLRVTEAIRVGGGVLVFKSAVESPFSKATETRGEPYASLSIDINVGATPDLLKNLFK